MLSKENQAILDHLIDLANQGKLSGEFPNIPNEVYHHPDCPGISSSNFSDLNQSYEHYLEALEDARKKRKEMDFRDKFFIGNAYHMATLEPELFDKLMARKPRSPREDLDMRLTTSKAIVKEWEEAIGTPWEIANAGKIAIPETQYDEIIKMRDKTLSHPHLALIIENGEKEVSYWWTDSKTGLLCKFRADVIWKDKKIILDLKSIGTFASASSFRKQITSMFYDRAMAYYLEGACSLFGDGWRFVWGVQEKRKPFGVQAFTPDEAMLEVGQKLFRAPLDKVHAIHLKKAPRSYSDDITVIGLPGYGFDVDSRLGD